MLGQDIPKKIPRTVLIAGPPFRGYLRMIGDGFRACGVEPMLLEWKYPKRNLFQEILYYSSKKYRLRRADVQHKVNALAVEKAVLETSPDLLLVMHAVELTPKTLDFCKSARTRTVLWAYDSLTEFPIISRVAPLYGFVYTYEPADIEILSRNCSPRHLPMAHDPRYYSRNDKDSAKDIDVCFIGETERYPKRRRMLGHIADRFKDRRIAVWADTIHWYSHRHMRDFLLAGLRKNIQLTRQTLDHEKISGIYNRSKVCLNVHHAQSKKAVNPRTFEILGSGGLLVTDRRLDNIEGFEDREGYLYYSDEMELVESLDRVFKDEQKAARIADIGHAKAHEHTFAHRARRILQDLK